VKVIDKSESGQSRECSELQEIEGKQEQAFEGSKYSFQAKAFKTTINIQ
jgi:hypothetical protein